AGTSMWRTVTASGSASATTRADDRRSQKNGALLLTKARVLCELTSLPVESIPSPFSLLFGQDRHDPSSRFGRGPVTGRLRASAGSVRVRPRAGRTGR